MAKTPTKFEGDGFVIRNCILKGNEECFNVKESNIGELIFNALNKNPDHVGQIDAQTGEKKTFGEIKERSVRLAKWLKNEGIGPGDVVSLCSPRHPDAEIIFYATSFVGAIYTPFTHTVDLAEARHGINTVQPRIIITHKDVIDILQEAAALENHSWTLIVINTDFDSDYKSLNSVLNMPSSEEIESFEVTKVNEENNCMIIPTSGTTGIFKFIPLSHKHFIRQVLQFVIIGKPKSPNNILLTYFYPGWIVQILSLVRSMLNRQTLVFHKAFEPRETCEIIEKYKINTLTWEVYMISLLAESNIIDKYDLQSVTHVHSVGSKLFDEVRGKILKIFPNVHAIGRGLGIIETGLLTLFTEKCRNPQSEGVVVPNVQLKIIDIKSGLPLRHNEAGELCAKSPCMMTGYYKNPQANKLAFDADGWFRSGDEAYYDENGEVIVVGRLKEIIKYREAYLQPLCIEQILLSHPNIVDAAVVGIFHEVHIEQPMAFLKVAQGTNVKEEDVLNLTRDLEYSDIFKNSIIFIDEIPRNTNGKINRRILREYAENLYRVSS